MKKQKKRKDDDLSRFNSSSSEDEEEEEEKDESIIRRIKSVVTGGGDEGDEDKEEKGEEEKKRPPRLNLAERKRLKKRDAQSAKTERRKRERERMEKARSNNNNTSSKATEEEEKAKKKKKKKKKNASIKEDEGDGGDVTETEEEEEEEEEEKEEATTETGMETETETRKSKKRNHATFEVEGVALDDGTLVLVDKRSLVVYSSEERDGNGEHKRVGTWDAKTKTVIKRDDKDDGNANRKFDNGDSSSSNSSSSSSDREEQDDDDGKNNSSSSEEEEEVEKREQREREHTTPVKLDVNHAFECNPDDHCETSLEAHKDIVNFLNIVASQKNKKPSELIIYDPYYCAGATRLNFTELGFPNVINENKDFYEMVAKNKVPEHDVFVTNPPYSEEHVEKCVTFAAKNMTQFGRPYFMLVPSYVVCKPYFVPALLTGGAQGEEERENTKEEDAEDDMNMHKKRGQVLPFYIAPTKRYYYFTPKPLAKLRNKNIDENGIEKKRRGHVGRRGERTSPFLSLWICGFGDDQIEALRMHKKLRREQVKHYVVARNPKEIPLNVLDEWDPRRREDPSPKKANIQDKKNKKKYF